MIGGEPAVAEPLLARVFDASGVDSSPAVLDGSPRLVARWIGRHVSRMRLQEPGFEVSLRLIAKASLPRFAQGRALMVGPERSPAAPGAASRIGSRACRSSR